MEVGAELAGLVGGGVALCPEPALFSSPAVRSMRGFSKERAVLPALLTSESPEKLPRLAKGFLEVKLELERLLGRAEIGEGVLSKYFDSEVWLVLVLARDEELPLRLPPLLELEDASDPLELVPKVDSRIPLSAFFPLELDRALAGFVPAASLTPSNAPTISSSVAVGGLTG